MKTIPMLATRLPRGQGGAAGMTWIVVLWILSNISVEADSGDDTPKLTDCQKVNSCSCRSSTLGAVDLSPLAKSDGSPRFLNVPAGTELYSWNPCQPFSQGTCSNVAVCQKVSFTTSSFYNLGTQDSARFVLTAKGLMLIYSADTVLARTGNDSANFMRTSFVKLICDVDNDPGQLVVIGEDPEIYGNYHFTLTSVHACPDKLKTESFSSMSIGTCLLITLSISFVAYLAIGAVVQGFVFKKSGCDVIPNRTAWASLPGYVKDGVVFVLSRGKSTPYVELK